MTKITKPLIKKLKKLEKHRDAITKEKESLERLMDDVRALHECTEQAVESLNDAIELLRQQA